MESAREEKEKAEEEEKAAEEGTVMLGASSSRSLKPLWALFSYQCNGTLYTSPNEYPRTCHATLYCNPSNTNPACSDYRT